ncbi:MAG TPA: LysR substrate-binding domain-containing protein [Gaiellaceae bacterium]|nr:LysR substrate-binding domain-containing protein [Gaiellaceae bacterium]
MEPDRSPDPWQGVEVRHLAALGAIAETGSFGRAAQRLGYTQSAVSQQIATLERLVGERLLDRPRGSRTIALTEAGELLVRHGAAIVARLRAAQADVEALRRGEAGQLRIGTFQSAGRRLLPDVLRRLAAELPHVDVRLTEFADDNELLELVERGELDVAFGMLPLPERPLEVQRLLRDPYVLVVPADAEAPPEPVALDALGSCRLIGYRSCRSHALAERQWRARGVEPDVVFRSDDNGTLQAMVAAGVGWALVPRLAVDEDDPRVRVLEVDPSVEPRVIVLVWHRDRHRTAAARRFVELAVERCAPYAAAA